MEIKTHKKINQRLCGKPIDIKDDLYAKVVLETNEDMVADDKGLVHGGFIFGAADYCAMLTVNDPNVVLGSAEVKFLKPVKVGDVLEFEGTIKHSDGHKRLVNVIARNQEDTKVFQGDFKCYILEKHVLE